MKKLTVTYSPEQQSWFASDEYREQLRHFDAGIRARDEKEKQRRIENGTENGKQCRSRKQKTKAVRLRWAEFNSIIDGLGFRFNLSPSELVTLLTVWRDVRADKDSTARTAQASIAQRTGICERTVIRAMKRLRELGLIVQVKPPIKGEYIAVYRVNVKVKNG